MFRRDHHSTDPQFAMIEKPLNSNEALQEHVNTAISTSPLNNTFSHEIHKELVNRDPTQESPLSSSPSSVSSHSNTLGGKLREKITKNIRPPSYLNALTSLTTHGLTGSMGPTSGSLPAGSSATSSPITISGPFLQPPRTASPSPAPSPRLGISPKLGSYPKMGSPTNSISGPMTPASVSTSSSLPLSNPASPRLLNGARFGCSNPSYSSNSRTESESPKHIPSKELLEVLAAVDPTNERLNGMLAGTYRNLLNFVYAVILS